MLYFQGMHGLGDTIYTRAFMPDDREIYLQTPWPEVFADMPNIHPVKHFSGLRTQKRNISRYQWYHLPPPHKTATRIGYSQSLVREMGKSIGLPFRGMSLPNFGPFDYQHRYAIVRPSTIRKEWANPARNPLSVYLHDAVSILQQFGYVVISIADVDGADEVYADAGRLYADVHYDNGELSTADMLRIVSHANVLVGGPGWLLPAGIAYQVPTFCIFGGNGVINNIDSLTCSGMNLNNIGWAYPDDFCQCSHRRHACSKHITAFRDRFAAWLAGLA